MDKFKCPKCSDTFKYKSLIKRHLKSVRCFSTDTYIEDYINKNYNKKTNTITNTNTTNTTNTIDTIDTIDTTNTLNIDTANTTNTTNTIDTTNTTNTTNTIDTTDTTNTLNIDTANTNTTTNNTNTTDTNNELHLFICDKCNNSYKYKTSLDKHKRKSKCYNNTNNITNNIINSNSNNNNNNNTNIINNINIQYINPFGFEDVRTIPITKMKEILISGTEAGLHIIKAIYDKIENKNFYKPNMSRPEIACLNEELKLTVYKSKEFADALFDRCIVLLHHMLYLCKNEFSNMNIKYIYENIEHIEITMRTEIYDKKLKNIIESEFLNNNIDNKDRIKNFIKIIKEDNTIKDNSLIQIQNNIELKNKQNEEYTKILTMNKLNQLFGDPRDILGLKKNEVILNLRISRFEESIFYNFWINRLNTIKQYVIENKSKIGDIINIKQEETKIMNMLDLIKNRVELRRCGNDYIDLNINDEFRLNDIKN
jgi:hypothetical protein